MSWLAPRKCIDEGKGTRPRRRRSADSVVFFDFLRRYGWIGLVLILTGCAIFAVDEYERHDTILAAMPLGFHFSGCDEAKAHGAVPLYRGDPGYSAALDPDGNGIACETAIAPGPG